MIKKKVFLTGQDNVGWALDEDVRLAQRALSDVVEFTNLKDCDIVHSIWWEGLVHLPKHELIGKRIICHLDNPPFHWLKQPSFRFAFELVGAWIVRSREAQSQMTNIGANSTFVPYIVDTEVFKPLSANDQRLIELRSRWNIPYGRYLIGNFHRDTEGRDLTTLKLQKGPDIFALIAYGLVTKGYPVHVLLAGPRRFWLRQRLEELGVPYTFVGQVVQGADDYPLNILPRSELNLLYNLLDLYLITSRWEGGPHSIMEAAASRCKVISTRVGLANDILEPSCIFVNPIQAIEIIGHDIANRHLDSTIDFHYHRIEHGYRTAVAAPLFRNLYSRIEELQPFAGFKNGQMPILSHPRSRSLLRRCLRRIGVKFAEKRLTISLWHKFFKPPYGGGNQFMLALKKMLEKRKVKIVDNKLTWEVDVHICNSAWFDVDRFLVHAGRKRLRMLHRIDGPISLYRGTDRTLDDQVFKLNAQFASATVVQSAWTYQRIVELGYHPIKPVIIHNAVDPEIFHSHGRVKFNSDRKVRLISTSWSDNPRKGGPTYKWIEEHLDWSRFEYTFVGRASEKFSRIHQIPPVPSEQLAEILRHHDIYIIASQNDPCSNALIEALACGLPAIYLNSGAHPELVSYAGLPFNKVEEILPQLDILVENYDMFQNVISVPSLDEVADKYLTLLQEIAL
jgi:glycosyltransferase involved in cell wall biosynthesis